MRRQMDDEAGVLDGLCYACGADLGGPFCGSCGAWNGPGQPPARPERVCPVCGTVNSPSNRHCQGCAFLLDRTPHAGSNRSPPGLVLAGAVLLGFALMVVVFINRAIGDDPETAGADPGATTSTTLEDLDTSVPRLENSPLEVSSVSASSSYSEALGPDNVIDGDPATYWNDASLHGENSELIFEFSSPVAIDSIVIQSPADEAAFIRNYRVRGYVITTDDVPTPITGELADSREQQTVEVASGSTSRLVLRITSTYEPRSFQGQPPFEELAVAEVAFVGRPSQ